VNKLAKQQCAGCWLLAAMLPVPLTCLLFYAIAQIEIWWRTKHDMVISANIGLGILFILALVIAGIVSIGFLAQALRVGTRPPAND